MGKLLEGCSILIVEDEPLIAMDLQRAFEAVGAHIERATTLEQAINLAEAADLDGAVVDHVLGTDNAARIYQKLHLRDVPFVVYSGCKEVAGLSPVNVLIVKPEHPSVLVQTVINLIRSDQTEGITGFTRLGTARVRG